MLVTHQTWKTKEKRKRKRPADIYKKAFGVIYASSHLQELFWVYVTAQTGLHYVHGDQILELATDKNGLWLNMVSVVDNDVN